MPKKIILVRHGETDHNARRIMQGHLDIPLNKNGIEQAERTGIVLKKEKIDIFFSSDLKRALVTAQKTVAYHNKLITITTLLRERDFGTLEGIAFDELTKIIPTFLLEKNFAVPEYLKSKYKIETDKRIKMRAAEFVARTKKHKNKNIAIFSHGSFIRQLLMEYGISPEIVKTMHIQNAQPIFLEKKGSRYIIVSQ